MGPQQPSALVTGLLTVGFGAFVGLGVWAIQSRIEALRKASDRLYDDRRKVYAELLEPVLRSFSAIRTPAERQKADALLASYEFQKRVFEFNLIAPDSVVSAFNDMMQYIYHAKSDSSTHVHVMRFYGGLLLALRKSVGEPKTQLIGRDMLRGFLSDIDDLWNGTPQKT